MRSKLYKEAILTCVAIGVVFLLAFNGYAQTWNMDRIKSVKRLKAEVIKVDSYQRMLTLKVYTNEMSGEYKTGWCTVDGNTHISKKGKRIEFTELYPKDKVYVGGVIYSNAKKSCRIVEVIESKEKTRSQGVKGSASSQKSSYSSGKVSSKSILVK